MARRLFVLLACSVFPVVVTAAAPDRVGLGGSVTEAKIEPPPIDYRILDQGGLRAITTNWGYIGNYGGRLEDPQSGEAAIPLEYPGGSGILYLYDAGLWVGGIVGGDTLVSTGTLSSWARHELFPDTGAAGLLAFDDYLADQGYQAAYADTITDPNIASPDRIDGIHRSLRVSVKQDSRVWADTIYQNLAWVQLTITNLGAETIEDAFIGWQVDPDVHHVDNRSGYSDDLVGYRQGNKTFAGETYPFEAVYAIDNDGDADSLSGFTGQSPTGALGLAYVSGAPEPAVRSFNWWVYNYYLDWGPHFPSPVPELPDLSGRPLGDVARYRMMSNGEIDYDQVYGGVDRTAEGWAPPPDTFFFAAGFDIRFLYSVGPFTILPGDSTTLNFIFFAGRGVHTDPEHFIHSFSFADPAPYLDGLDFGHWETTIAAAHHLYASDFAAAAPGPPEDIRLESWTTTEATLRWRRKGTFDLAGYEIFKKNPAGEYPDVPLATVSVLDSTFTDTGLEPGDYSYAVKSFDMGDRHGRRSADVPANLRVPMAVKLLEAVPANKALTLAWNASIYPDVAGYHIARIQETAPGETTTVIIGQTTEEDFVDYTPQEATIYEYTVTAESGTGVLGWPSNRLPGMLMAFDGGPLIVDQTLADPSGMTDKDSVRAFWQRILPDATYKDEDRALPPTLELFDFNPHPVTIVVSSGNFSETEPVRDLLQKYFIAGGNVLFVGRDLFNLTDLAYGDRYFAPGDFEYDFLGLTKIYYPPTVLAHPTRMNAEFIGAKSCADDLPDLPVDSARTDWGVPEQLQPVGPAVPFVGWLEGDPVRTQRLYTFESLFPDTSSSEGKTVGLFFNDGRRRAAVLNFPPAMMQEDAARIALDHIIVELGYAVNRPGDFNGDGLADAVDAVLLISYLFRNGEPPVNLRNGDVNTDCTINLVDAVILINYIYRSGPAPGAGCAL